MSGPNGHPGIYRTQRFQIASRIGAFRDTITLSDPLGTSARFIITRKGSNLHKAWSRDRMDSDPIMAAVTEEMVIGADPVILTEEEAKTVEISRIGASSETDNLLAIIDRLTDTAETLERNRTAIRKAVATGQVKYSDALFRGAERRTAEALFLLRWDFLPDENGDAIPYTTEAAHDLLTNDTPLADAGLDDLLLSQDCAVVILPSDPADPDSSPRRLLIPDLTLGGFYVLWAHWASEQKSLFRDQVLEEAGKNSPPPSDPISSSGGGTSAEVVS